MKDKHGRVSKPFFPLKQMRACEVCGEPFFPSKRHKFICKPCFDYISMREVKNAR